MNALRTTTRPGTRRIGVGSLGALGALALLALLAWLLPYETTMIWWQIRAHIGPYVLLPLALIAVGGLIGALVSTAISRALGHPRTSEPPMWPVVLGMVAGAGLAIFALFALPYMRAAAYAESTSVISASEQTTEQVGTFDYRLPYAVARAQARTAVDGIPGAELTDNTRYVPTEDDVTGEAGGKFYTLVEGRSALGKYAAVAEQTYIGGGRTTATQCTFSDSASGETLGGWFNHNLGREISAAKRWVNWSSSDAYGYCEDGVPLVVVPLKAQSGWLSTEAPYGAAIYNGYTGELVIERDPAKIPGKSSYPMSLAERQLASSGATEGWWPWIRGIAGYKAADGTAEQMVLRRTVDGRSHASYTTQVSFQGSTTSIVGISTLDSSDWVPGQRADLVTHRLPQQWQSAEAIVKRIENDYRNIPNWQNLHVSEIAPAAATQFNTTIGNEQNVAYAIRGNGDLQDMAGLPAGVTAASCLFTAPDFANAHQCGSQALRAGNGIGIAYGRDGNADAAVARPSGPGVGDSENQGAGQGSGRTDEIGAGSITDADLGSMTPQELADLQRRLAEEWLRRAPGN